MNNSRAKKMLKDVALFSVASFGPKLLSFFLVPLYTTVLSTEEYGIFDLLNTVYSLMLPVFMLDISDAILIYTVEMKNDTLHKVSPLAYGTKILGMSSALLSGAAIIIAAFSNRKTIYIYIVYVVAQYIVNALYNNLLAYLRGIDDVITVVVASIIHSLVTLLSNVIFIVGTKWGIYGLLIASLLGGIVADAFISLKINLIPELKRTEKLSKNERKAMLKYSIPLIFTGLAWWVNSSSDRLFISAFIGVGLNGIYAVANKIPTILSACHSIIYQAMQLSVFKESKAEDKSEYYLRLYRIYAFLMTFACSILISLDKLIARFLFKGDFYIAWKFSPALLISIAIYSIAGYMTTIYAAGKKTSLIATSTVCGAVVNTILNAVLIPKFELFGAVIATAIGYFSIWGIMMWNAREIMNTKSECIRSVFGFVILACQWIALIWIDKFIYIQFFFMTIIVILYFSTINELYLITINLIRELILEIRKGKNEPT